jgi:hypothetical protein
MRRVGGIALLALVTGCAHGVGSREYWRGMSDGTSGECAPLYFDISILNHQIEGYATSTMPQASAMWDVKGSVTPDDQVTVETTTQDPRLGARKVMWRGVWKRLSLTFTQVSPMVCDPPRTARLQPP